MTMVDRISMAITRIQEKGWAQGNYEKINGAGCLVRALHSDAEFAEFYTTCRHFPEIENVCDLLPAGAYDRGGYLRCVSWNDASYRTENDVLALLETTRDRLIVEKRAAEVGREQIAMAAIEQEFAHEWIPVPGPMMEMAYGR